VFIQILVIKVFNLTTLALTAHEWAKEQYDELMWMSASPEMNSVG